MLLTGSLTAGKRRQALDDIQQGRVDLVIGTQALIQKDVQFQRLGLVVIDEQHKFGVLQRARMSQELGVGEQERGRSRSQGAGVGAAKAGRQALYRACLRLWHPPAPCPADRIRIIW